MVILVCSYEFATAVDTCLNFHYTNCVPAKIPKTQMHCLIRLFCPHQHLHYSYLARYANSNFSSSVCILSIFFLLFSLPLPQYIYEAELLKIIISPKLKQFYLCISSHNLDQSVVRSCQLACCLLCGKQLTDVVIYSLANILEHTAAKSPVFSFGVVRNKIYIYILVYYYIHYSQ